MLSFVALTFDFLTLKVIDTWHLGQQNIHQVWRSCAFVRQLWRISCLRFVRPVTLLFLKCQDSLHLHG